MFLRRHFRWNDLHEERKIKDKHLKRMPLILRNKILYGGKDSTKSTCGHHSKAKRLDGEDILTISSVMFPGAHVSIRWSFWVWAQPMRQPDMEVCGGAKGGQHPTATPHPILFPPYRLPPLPLFFPLIPRPSNSTPHIPTR